MYHFIFKNLIFVSYNIFSLIINKKEYFFLDYYAKINVPLIHLHNFIGNFITFSDGRNASREEKSRHVYTDDVTQGLIFPTKLKSFIIKGSLN